MKTWSLLTLALLCSATWFSLGSGDDDESSPVCPAISEVYLSLGSCKITTNNTEILITDIGDIGGQLSPLVCHTDLTACCRNDETNRTGRLGMWHLRNGTDIASLKDSWKINRGPQVVNLFRRSETSFGPTGSYCCTIPTSGGINITFCVNIVDCLSLPKLTNGKISYSDPTLDLNTTATHSCDPGFTLSGHSVRSCGNNGIWSGSAPTCQVISTKDMDSPPTTSSTMGDNLPSSTSLTCIAGIGVLAVLWVVTTIGWIASCIVFMKQRQTRDKIFITAISTTANQSYTRHDLSEQLYDDVARVSADGGEYSNLDREQLQGAAGCKANDTPTYDYVDHSQIRRNKSQDMSKAVRKEHTCAAIAKKKARKQVIN